MMPAPWTHCLSRSLTCASVGVQHHIQDQGKPSKCHHGTTQPVTGSGVISGVIIAVISGVISGAPTCRCSCVQHYRKNQYEEALFRAEDDHFELDLLIEQCSSAIRALQASRRA